MEMGITGNCNFLDLQNMFSMKGCCQKDHEKRQRKNITHFVCGGFRFLFLFLGGGRGVALLFCTYTVNAFVLGLSRWLP